MSVVNPLIALTTRKGVLTVVAAIILFVLSGLFLMNTVMHPSDSFPYFVGKVLCIGVSPILLISGILMLLIARRNTKELVTTQQLIAAHTAKILATSLPAWEQRARKIYGVVALLLIGLLVLTWSPLMLFGLVLLIPYIVFFAYMLMGKRNLVVSLFFFVLWYFWFSVAVIPLSPIHFSQIFTEAIKNPPYFGPLGYNVWWMFYSVVMLPGIIMLLFSALSGIKMIEKVMARIFTAKTGIVILMAPMVILALPPAWVANPNMVHPSIVSAQAVDIGINTGGTERYFNQTSGEWVYSIAVMYNGPLLLTNISLGGIVISPPFNNGTVRITEYNKSVTPNFSNSGVIVITDKTFVNWVSLVSGNNLGEAIYGIGWF